jgi:hypothetical protein
VRRDDGQKLESGDIVQIDPAHDPGRFGACLLVVTEVKSWGVQGYVQNAGSEGQAYYRVEFDSIESTGGKAQWVPE